MLNTSFLLIFWWTPKKPVNSGSIATWRVVLITLAGSCNQTIEQYSTANCKLKENKKTCSSNGIICIMLPPTRLGEQNHEKDKFILWKEQLVVPKSMFYYPRCSQVTPTNFPTPTNCKAGYIETNDLGLEYKPRTPGVRQCWRMKKPSVVMVWFRSKFWLRYVLHLYIYLYNMRRRQNPWHLSSMKLRSYHFWGESPVPSVLKCFKVFGTLHHIQAFNI